MIRLYCLTIFCLFTGLLTASIIPVSSLNDAGAGSLRNAVKIASPQDTLDLGSLQGIIRLDSQIRISKNLTLWGPGPDKLTLDGQDLHRILWVDTFRVVQISGLHFDRGNAYLDSTDLFSSGGAIRNFGVLELEDCLFTSCFGGFGGAIHNYGFGADEDSVFLLMRNCTFMHNRVDPPKPNFELSPRSGGAIYSDARRGFAVLEAENCHFLSNFTRDDGGAICIFSDRGDTTTALRLIHCTFTDNIAANKGGAYIQEEGVNYIKNTIIAGNLGRPDNPDVHGALFSHGGTLVGRIILNSSVVYRSNAGTDYFNLNPELGPVMYQENGLPARVPLCGSPVIAAGEIHTAGSRDCRGVVRDAPPDLGACQRSATDIQVTKLADSGFGSLRYAMVHSCAGDTLNMRQLAGGIELDSQLVARHTLVLQGNLDDALIIKGDGRDRLLTVEDTVSFTADFINWTNGRADQFGGGAIRNFGKLYLGFCSLYDNEAPSGGAIGNYGLGDSAAFAYLINCTLSRNRATALDGGALENVPLGQAATLKLEHCTLADNQAARRGGGLFNLGNASDTDVSLSIVANNRSATGPDLYGRFGTVRGHNLLSDTTGTFGAAPLGSGGLLRTNPGLLPLSGSYGGPTRCHALEAASPAIDAGINTALTTIDQRGYARRVGNRVDIGAYEYDALTGIEPGNTPHFQAYPNPGSGPLRLQGAAIGKIRRVTIVDLQGRLHFSMDVPSGSTPLKLDLAGLSPGLYYLKLEGNDLNEAIPLLRQ